MRKLVSLNGKYIKITNQTILFNGIDVNKYNVNNFWVQKLENIQGNVPSRTERKNIKCVIASLIQNVGGQLHVIPITRLAACLS